MNEEPFILGIDLSKQAVIEPGVENLQYKFHEKLLFAFVPDDEINSFLDKRSHKTLGKFKPENTIFVPQRAIRGEGTSFYYKEPSKIITLNKKFVRSVENEIKRLGLQYEEGTTWTTDGFFRETPKQVLQAKELGAKTVEMECSALAACAEFRNINFAQILFTADSLADMDNYDKRNWGHDSYSVGLNIGSQVLVNL